MRYQIWSIGVLLTAKTGTDEPSNDHVAGSEFVWTERLDLVPLAPAHAAEMTEALADQRLYLFIGGSPPSADQLRARFERLVSGGTPDGSQEWLNWIVRLKHGEAIGTVQATIVDHGQRADVAWLIGVAWQRRGYASEAVTALVGWLQGRGVEAISAHIRPGHVASEVVAARAGLAPTVEIDHEGERLWSLDRNRAAAGRDGPASG